MKKYTAVGHQVWGCGFQVTKDQQTIDIGSTKFFNQPFTISNIQFIKIFKSYQRKITNFINQIRNGPTDLKEEKELQCQIIV